MTTKFATADLYDDHGSRCESCETPFRQFGACHAFAGRIRTVHSPGDNVLVRRTLESPGNGAVLVVDGGGSLGCALVGDIIGALGVKNGWAGVVIFGAVRDTSALAKLEIGLKALGSNPKKSEKRGTGETDVAVSFGHATFTPGHWLYSDDDGILVCPDNLLAA